MRKEKPETKEKPEEDTSTQTDVKIKPGGGF